MLSFEMKIVEQFSFQNCNRRRSVIVGRHIALLIAERTCMIVGNGLDRSAVSERSRPFPTFQ